LEALSLKFHLFFNISCWSYCRCKET
jgi:hypothetical protein